MAIIRLHRGDRGRRVKRLQQEINQTLANRDFGWRRVRTDGTLGPHTLKAAQMAGWLQGLSRKQLGKIHRGTITWYAFRVLTHQRRRTDAMKKRTRERAKYAAKLRRQHAESQQPASGVGSFDGRAVAAWIVPWLEKSRANGWHGSLVSGYRTPEYSESLCQAMCDAPTCPGRCAGRASNHSGSDYPAGAIDVSDYWTFGAIQPRIGSPLRNALGSQDPVHFSVSGR